MINFSSSHAVNLFARVDIFAHVYLLARTFPHFNTPETHTFQIAPSATDSGVISPLVATSYLAHASPHSSAISPIFAAVVSLFPAPITSAHFLNPLTLFGQINALPISVIVSPIFAPVELGL